MLVRTVALCAVLACASAGPTAAPVWQGWEYQWLHRVLGFQTPHRLGSFASLLSDIDVSDDGSQLSAVYQTSLTVGATTAMINCI